MASLSIQGVSKTFANGHRVLDDITIDVASGEFLTLLGPSGCGKTTLLKAIAGFHPLTSGRFLIDGKDVTALPPESRNTAMCFQSYALFPHMTVAENILFGPRQSGAGKAECHARLDAALQQVDLVAHATKLPSALSGGQQQRVALARAMAMRPGVILFDEPLSNLDAKLREQVRFEIRALQAKHGFTAIYVTHDQAEALAMSDRIVVLNGGRIEQIDTPAAIYDRPASRFVADFIGAANILKADILGLEAETTWRVRTDLGEFDIRSESDPKASNHFVCWRPEAAEIVLEAQTPQSNTFQAVVTAQAFQGNVTDVLVRSGKSDAAYRIQTRRPLTVGASVMVRVDPASFCFLEATH
ncbi:ABC-type Fe3+/spermidine/putrescine transport system ATPase subunit [Rhizobium leguminosarum]|uniref:ABC-type Fe3+/spermidine/putrescine transport system ATPase subunit n=1 Tax=Rhizobium leguminosarum TaxID=384 RepID=A0AAE2MPF7_RHILE|nr:MULTISPECIES: ABC transporter ATP-binding protein [Rhizobium]MBB4293076.1 ABC-type Fe3+/spermidine/putrescine transport system ATPase subunit [Rhizobium leguminosarum]MBB4300101.1 ABC-type Fe3+/spermidine/putrescine transport system ATPase subunit [Rhizobium leguminosarum]MBB4311227.1 ABC-type Fe3+/spermidine/putrescine transport system ATPase subunit [Rhizobium leguminosarum]MBB4435454.1 ABC-type Fe3+/spermidine/putrescine transport system ATPase subunit [Rhizobium esperanzae]MBB4532386.1 